jgi:signal transduction histidine kinase
LVGGDWLVIVRNVTRLHNLEQMRKDFVANVSHELKTPLTVLKGYLETLLDTRATGADTFTPGIRSNEPAVSAAWKIWSMIC